MFYPELPGGKAFPKFANGQLMQQGSSDYFACCGRRLDWAPAFLALAACIFAW